MDHTTSVVTLVAVLSGSTAFAQDTRAGVIEYAQVERQRTITPPAPSRGERIVDRLETWGLFSGTPRGLHPWAGSVFPGAGFGLGAGFRKGFGDDGALRTVAAYALSGSTRIDADVELPTFARRRARVSFTSQYVDAKQVRFFGFSDTSGPTPVLIGFAPKRAGVRLDVTPGRRLSLRGGVNYLAFDTTDAPVPPPGVDYLNHSVRAVFDWTRPLGYSGHGGDYRVQFDGYRQRGGHGRGFRAFEADVRQLLPLVRANWVVALRGLVTLTDIAPGSEVPFFMLPPLGGGGTLRGYPDARFRDRHRMLMTVELRWTPARFLDMAMFYDAGKVASRRGDLDLRRLHDSYGLGARIVGPKGYVLGVEVARSREHAARLLVKAGGGF
jgi:hypothetical protein